MIHSDSASDKHGPGSLADIRTSMAVLKPRSHMISVRLSDEEYSALMGLCLVTGARSISDLARDAMRALQNGANREVVPGSYMDEFRSQMRSMDKKIEQLSAEITMFKRSRTTE